MKTNASFQRRGEFSAESNVSDRFRHKEFLYVSIRVEVMFLFSSHFSNVSASLQVSGNYIEKYRFDFLFRVDSVVCVTGNKS